MVHLAFGLSILLPALLATSVWSTFTPNLEFNITILDTFPGIIYGGDLNTKFPTTDWVQSFSGSPSSTYTPGMYGEGVSSHTVDKSPVPFNWPGNYLSFLYYGTAVDVRFSLDPFSNSTVVRVGSTYNTPPTQAEPQTAVVLSNIPGVDSASLNPIYQSIGAVPANWSQNNALFDVYPNYQVFSYNQNATMNVRLSFYNATFTTRIQTQAASLSSIVQRYAPVARNRGVNDAYQYTGSWTFVGKLGNSTQTVRPISSLKGAAGSTCNIKLPANTSYVIVNGTLGYQQGNVTFTIFPPPPVDGFLDTVSTSNSFAIPSPLYQTPLDPAMTYELTVSVERNGPAIIDTVTVYSGLNDQNWAADFGVKAATPNNNTPPGIIAGGVVGGAIGALALAGIIFKIFQKRREKQRVFKGTLVDVDPREQPNVQPFTSTREARYTPVATGEHSEPTSSEYDPTSPFSATRSGSEQLSKAEEAAAAYSAAASGEHPWDGTSPAASSSRNPAPVIPNLRDEDAGSLSTNPPLPPSYNPNWTSPTT